MSRPDPNGCRDCGLPDCRLSALLDKPMKKRTLEEWGEIREARRQCSARPAVDWQAAYRALAAERAASPPQEVVEAARRIGELASKATPGEWRTTTGLLKNESGRYVGPERCMVAVKGRDYSVASTGPVSSDDSHADAAFIAECRTLAPLLAEWVNGGGK